MIQLFAGEWSTDNRYGGGEATVVHRWRRVLVVCVLGLALPMAGAAAAWQILHPPLHVFIVPGATEIQIRADGFGEQQLTYRSSGAPYAWYFTVARNLARDGWSAPIDNRLGIRATPETHWRISPVWFGYIKEEVMLQGDPNIARILLRRTIIIPWARYLP
jgi:hypothetical protein